MSLADVTDVPPDVTPKGATRPAVWPVFCVVLFAAVLMSLPNLIDPMIRYDDYPAYFADAPGFWPKTLHEGRWVNYLWHLREAVTPAWLNFAVYQALWAGFAAALAVLVTGRGGLHWFAVTLGLMVLVAPPALLISLWFNTLLPGLALVTLYAVLATRLSVWALRSWLPVFTVLTFMAYTTYPLLLLAIALVATKRRSFLDLIGLLALFTLSFIAAVLVTYAVNWQVHGVFGVPLAEWRDASPAADMAGYLANLPVLWESLDSFLTKTSYDFFPATVFHLVLLAGGLGVLLHRTPLEGLYLAAGLVTGLSLVAVQVMKLGAEVPPRAFIFAWTLYAVIVVRAAQELSEQPGLAGRMARNAVLLIVGSYLLQVFQQYMTYRDWQSETRAFAAEIDGTVLVMGHPMETGAAQKAGIQNDLAFSFRIKQLSGEVVVICANSPADCEGNMQGQTDQSTVVQFPN